MLSISLWIVWVCTMYNCTCADMEGTQQSCAGVHVYMELPSAPVSWWSVCTHQQHIFPRVYKCTCASLRSCRVTLRLWRGLANPPTTCDWRTFFSFFLTLKLTTVWRQHGADLAGGCFCLWHLHLQWATVPWATCRGSAGGSRNHPWHCSQGARALPQEASPPGHPPRPGQGEGAHQGAGEERLHRHGEDGRQLVAYAVLQVSPYRILTIYIGILYIHIFQPLLRFIFWIDLSFFIWFLKLLVK